VGAAASPAGAVAYPPASQSGSAGAFYVTRTAARPNFTIGSWRLDSGPFTVYRSPSFTGTQLITIRWRVWEFSGGVWRLQSGGAPSIRYTAYPGQRASFTGWGYPVETFFSSRFFATDF
jgi:hypothetical protein